MAVCRERLLAVLEGHGDKPALIVSGHRAVSYAELVRHALAFAKRLGATRRLLLVEASTCEHAIVAYLGARLCGHAVLLAAPQGAVGLADLQERFAPDAVYRQSGGRWRLEIEAANSGPLHEDLALLLVTSGSTGAGKAVRLSAGALEANALAIADYLGLGQDDRTALLLPLHYSYGLSVLNAHLIVGASIDIGFGSVRDADFCEHLQRSGCTNLSGVPYTYELLERMGFRDRLPPMLRFMTVAGGRLSPEIVLDYDRALTRRGGRFFVMYGQTEATARMAYLPPEQVVSHPDFIGIAIAGGSLSLEDENGAPIRAPDIQGELVYRGPNVMMGYAETRADLARGAELEKLRTGDLAERNADGLYRIVGRRARFSKIGGLRIGHDAIEAALARRQVSAAVIGNDSTLMVAFTGSHASQTVCRWVVEASGLTAHHVRVLGMSSLPRLASGKIDLVAISAAFRAAPARDERIDAIFREVFYPHPVREGDSFLSLAGDSLRFVELSAALERRLGYIPEQWERLSLAQLSRLTSVESAETVLGSDLLIRALAIVCIVTQHATLWPIPGGSAAMMVLIGFSLARFQRQALIAADWKRVLRPLITVLLPYYAIVAVYAIVWEKVPWASVFLVGNFGFAEPERHEMLPFLYWFVEAYVQIMIGMVALFALPAVRSFVARRPFAAALAFLGVAFAFRVIGPLIYPLNDNRYIFTLPWVVYLVAFGWCAALADRPARRHVVLATALVTMAPLAIDGGNWAGAWIKHTMVIAAIAALLYVPALRSPRWLAVCVLSIASASFEIYLFHRFVPELLLERFQQVWPPTLFTIAAVVGGVLLGLALKSLMRRFKISLRSLVTHRGARDDISLSSRST